MSAMLQDPQRSRSSPADSRVRKPIPTILHDGSILLDRPILLERYSIAHLHTSRCASAHAMCVIVHTTTKSECASGAPTQARQPRGRIDQKPRTQIEAGSITGQPPVTAQPQRRRHRLPLLSRSGSGCAMAPRVAQPMQRTRWHAVPAVSNGQPLPTHSPDAQALDRTHQPSPFHRRTQSIKAP